ncbi:MAG: aminoacetone oxidase family FAD-binding enzyme, partial [Candidatus Omnitrophica bacterium]|nr:aminoacetone oxidase family FAD-binding enzyme [Candidatus Omnitrophota bacterium]
MMPCNDGPSATFDVAVIGGGAAGAMAAIRAGINGARVALFERNDSIGRKILITGKGRCNITNSAPMDVFVKKFGRSGNFLRSALYVFFNDDIVEFFRSNGLEMKTERQGRVFPVTDRARSVVDVLVKCLAENKVKIIYNAPIASVRAEGGLFRICPTGADAVMARKVILATGGISYKATGSTGDGFMVAKGFGHTVAPLKAGLVPLTTKEEWVKDLQGLALENIRIMFQAGKKKISSDIGELMFTHFGVSGPLVLDLSGDVLALLG